MKVKSESEVAQSCPTLSDPMDWILPGSSVYGIFPGKSTGGAIAFADMKEYIMRNAGLDEAQARIKIAGINIK